MAELGPGPHCTGDIADLMEVKITDLGATRANLLKKGMIFSPSHGDMAFTVPLFDEFMRRAVPGFRPMIRELFFMATPSLTRQD